MMLLCPPIDTTDKVFSITPSSMSVGAVTSLTGFTLGGDSLGVTSSTGYGFTGKTFGLAAGYVGAPDFTEALFETKARARDVVVTTWSRFGHWYLRCDRTTGRAVVIKWNGNSNGTINVSYATNVPDTLPEFFPGDDIGGSVAMFSSSNVASLVTGWNEASTSGDELVFSLIGPNLSITWNGQTIYETDELWFAMKPGTVLFSPILSYGAIRDTTITFKANSATYTDGDNNFLDFRDWGWKTTTTTGSMSAASTTLTVASSAGFAIGDHIFVEIGGESGLGERGTVGVGGSWPTASAANVAALPDATTFRTANGNVDCYIWVESESAVYLNFLSSGTPTWGEWTDYVTSDTLRVRAYWHTTTRLPRALRAIITNIVGNTITLDTPSVAATTNANVYYDCGWVVPYLMPESRFNISSTNAISNDAWNIRFGTGTFCFPEKVNFPYANYWTFRGTGRTTTELYAPKGGQMPRLAAGGEYMEFSDFKVRGWNGEKYFCFNEVNTYPSYVGSHSILPTGTYKSGGLVERIDFVNTWGGVSLETRFGATCRDCTALQTNGNNQQYATWFFQASYCDPNTWIEDCTYTATEVGTAFEIFQQDGGGIRRCTATQGLMASNSSGGGFLIEDVVISVDWNVRTALLDWAPADAPMININTNIGGGALAPEIIAEGGTIRNPTIAVLKDSTGKMFDAININGGGVNITVEGTHTAKPGEGVITMSDYESGDVSPGAVGIRLDTAGCTIRGMRVIGAASNGDPYYNISAYGSGADCVIEDCVAETIYIGAVSQIGTNGNITNAAYEALP